MKYLAFPLESLSATTFKSGTLYNYTFTKVKQKLSLTSLGQSASQ